MHLITELFCENFTSYIGINLHFRLHLTSVTLRKVEAKPTETEAHNDFPQYYVPDNGGGDETGVEGLEP